MLCFLCLCSVYISLINVISISSGKRRKVKTGPKSKTKYTESDSEYNPSASESEIASDHSEPEHSSGSGNEESDNDSRPGSVRTRKRSSSPASDCSTFRKGKHRKRTPKSGIQYLDCDTDEENVPCEVNVSSYVKKSDGRFQCTICPRTFDTKTVALLHITNSHLRCTESTCKRKFTSLEALISHQQNGHPKTASSESASIEESSPCEAQPAQNVQVIADLQDVQSLTNVTEQVRQLHGLSASTIDSVNTRDLQEKASNALKEEDHKAAMAALKKAAAESKAAVKNCTLKVRHGACLVQLVLLKYRVTDRDSFVLNWKCRNCATQNINQRFNDMTEAANHVAQIHQTATLQLYPVVIIDPPDTPNVSPVALHASIRHSGDTDGNSQEISNESGDALKNNVADKCKLGAI